MTRSSYSLLPRTDLDLSELDGVVEYVGDVVVVHQPKNPGYRWGNFLQLPGPPTAEELDRRIEEFERRFASDPAIEHVTLRWDGAPPAPAVARLAAERGMTRDGGLEMVAESLSPPSQSELVVRQLDMVHERPLIVALNIACDPSEQQGDSGYVEFKQRTREAWWAWHAAGAASWWGAFLQGELVGQCGFVSCSDGLGRFQSVETHPDHLEHSAWHLRRHLGHPWSHLEHFLA